MKIVAEWTSKIFFLNSSAILKICPFKVFFFTDFCHNFTFSGECCEYYFSLGRLLHNHNNCTPKVRTLTQHCITGHQIKSALKAIDFFSHFATFSGEPDFCLWCHFFPQFIFVPTDHVNVLFLFFNNLIFFTLASPLEITFASFCLFSFRNALLILF